MSGAALTALCGLLLWQLPLGTAWVNGSYDYLFRFGSPAVTNQVVLILMDNDAFDHFDQTHGQPWDRGLNAQLLDRLAADGCALVVMDSFFRKPMNPAKDAALAAAMHRHRHVVLMAEQAQVTHPVLAGVQPTLPADIFLRATGTNWGVAWLDPDLDTIVRRHWPFPSPGPHPSLPWVAARLAGAKLDAATRERWLRYYGREGAWTRLSYRFALTQPKDYFRDKIIFIGTQPKTSLQDGELDEFCTPYTRWTGETTGGVEILLTSFLNLVNGDWLRRPVWWAEAGVLVFVGGLLGGLLCRIRPLFAGVTAGVIALAVSLGAITWSHHTNYWFPWLVVVGGQLPCALAWAVFSRRIQPANAPAPAVPGDSGLPDGLPNVPDYEVIRPAFGHGAYGKVWLARNAVGQWQALKAVYLAQFGEPEPYDREFNGIKNYKPISDKHPGLLRVDFVSKKRADHFYYVMELGDALEPGWETDPARYKPRDLASERNRRENKRLPVPECVRIGLAITEALEFLHGRGLTHRDIKPQNIIFVNGQPKLADVGLITEIRPPDQDSTFVGTPSYMPPRPERCGTVQADIYALGMVLYVLSTGRNAGLFPEISTSLFSGQGTEDFLALNQVILKACNPDCAERYPTAAEMHRALADCLARPAKC